MGHHLNGMIADTPHEKVVKRKYCKDRRKGNGNFRDETFPGVIIPGNGTLQSPVQPQKTTEKNINKQDNPQRHNVCFDTPVRQYLAGAEVMEHENRE
jgi:hypothetical protein